MVTIIKLISTSITLHSYPVYACAHVMRTLKIYFLRKFQIYNTVLFTLITMLYIRYKNVFILELKVCFLWPTFSHFLPPGYAHLPLAGTVFFGSVSDFFRFHMSARS